MKGLKLINSVLFYLVQLLKMIPLWVRWTFVLGVCFWWSIIIGLYITFLRPNNPTSVAKVHQLIGSELPTGTPKNRVVQFLENRGLNYSDDREEREIVTLIRDTARDFFVVTDIQIIFEFDEQNRLQNYRVKEVYTGL